MAFFFQQPVNSLPFFVQLHDEQEQEQSSQQQFQDMLIKSLFGGRPVVSQPQPKQQVSPSSPSLPNQHTIEYLPDGSIILRPVVPAAVTVPIDNHREQLLKQRQQAIERERQQQQLRLQQEQEQEKQRQKALLLHQRLHAEQQRQQAIQHERQQRQKKYQQQQQELLQHFMSQFFGGVLFPQQNHQDEEKAADGDKQNNKPVESTTTTTTTTTAVTEQQEQEQKPIVEEPSPSDSDDDDDEDVVFNPFSVLFGGPSLIQRRRFNNCQQRRCFGKQSCQQPKQCQKQCQQQLKDEQCQKQQQQSSKDEQSSSSSQQQQQQPIDLVQLIFKLFDKKVDDKVEQEQPQQQKQQDQQQPTTTTTTTTTTKPVDVVAEQPKPIVEQAIALQPTLSSPPSAPKTTVSDVEDETPVEDDINNKQIGGDDDEQYDPYDFQSPLIVDIEPPVTTTTTTTTTTATEQVTPLPLPVVEEQVASLSVVEEAKIVEPNTVVVAAVEPTAVSVATEPVEEPTTNTTSTNNNQSLLTKLYQQTENLYTKRTTLLTKIKSLSATVPSPKTNPKVIALQNNLKQIDALIEQTHQYTQQLLDELDNDDDDEYNLIDAESGDEQQ